MYFSFVVLENMYIFILNDLRSKEVTIGTGCAINSCIKIGEKTLIVYIFINVMYEGCSKCIAYFYLETSNFRLALNCSFHAIEVLPVARNAKLQPMYPLP